MTLQARTSQKQKKGKYKASQKWVISIKHRGKAYFIKYYFLTKYHCSRHFPNLFCLLSVQSGVTFSVNNGVTTWLLYILCFLQIYSQIILVTLDLLQRYFFTLLTTGILQSYSSFSVYPRVTISLLCTLCPLYSYSSVIFLSPISRVTSLTLCTLE